MNERIQKLIEQATSTQGPTPYNPLTFEVFDKEKFAQLIVQECLDTVQRGVEGFGSRNPDTLVGGRLALGYSYRWIQARFSMGPYKDSWYSSGPDLSGVEE